ncbi:MAG: hypothetical protein WC966_01800 [Bradymonadales bacterium]|jgi:hypothetical protein
MSVNSIKKEIAPASAKVQRAALYSLGWRTFALSHHKVFVAIYLFSLPLLALFSHFFLSFELEFTDTRPGGNALELAFWMTALAASFFAFFAMEQLFRAKDSRFLATQPVAELAIFLYKIRFFLLFIAFSTPPIAAFWFPYALNDPIRAILNIGLWFFGLFVCCLLSLAIVLYGATNASTNKITNYGPTAYVAAPAIALAASLLVILLLKMLVEALLKTGFLNAALTALGIVLGAALLSFVYAQVQCKRHYYRIWAEFNENDLILLNEDYAFLNEHSANAILGKDLLAVLSYKDELQYTRRASLIQILIITLSVLLSLWLIFAPERLFELNLVLLSVLPLMIFAHPWLVLFSHALEPGILETEPLELSTKMRAKLRSSIKLSFRAFLPSLIAIGIPLFMHAGLAQGLQQSLLALLLWLVLTCFHTLVAVSSLKLSTIFSYTSGLIILLFSLIAQAVWLVFALIALYILFFAIAYLSLSRTFGARFNKT